MLAKRVIPFALLVALLSGCAGYVQMMPRDSGKVYSGVVKGSVTGSGTMSIDIDGQTYSGPVVRTGSNDSFGFIQQYGKRGMVSTGTIASVGSTATNNELVKVAVNLI